MNYELWWDEYRILHEFYSLRYILIGVCGRKFIVFTFLIIKVHEEFWHRVEPFTYRLLIGIRPTESLAKEQV